MKNVTGGKPLHRSKFYIMEERAKAKKNKKPANDEPEAEPPADETAPETADDAETEEDKS